MKLETLENTNAGKGYAIRLETAEVVSRCPMTGLPDYYRVIITYEPGASLVELKSLKLYFVEFLDMRTIHEDLLNTVVDDFIDAVSPKWVHVLVTANVRGGIEASLSRFWSADEGDEIGTAVEMMLERD